MLSINEAPHSIRNQRDFRTRKINPSMAITPCSSIDDLLSIYTGIKLLSYFLIHWFSFGEILRGLSETYFIRFYYADIDLSGSSIKQRGGQNLWNARRIIRTCRIDGETIDLSGSSRTVTSRPITKGKALVRLDLETSSVSGRLRGRFANGFS